MDNLQRGTVYEYDLATWQKATYPTTTTFTGCLARAPAHAAAAHPSRQAGVRCIELLVRRLCFCSEGGNIYGCLELRMAGRA